METYFCSGSNIESEFFYAKTPYYQPQNIYSNIETLNASYFLLYLVVRYWTSLKDTTDAHIGG